MKKFLVRAVLFVAVVVVVLELFFRVVCDPFYFYYIDSYSRNYDNIRDIYTRKVSEHVDYLFIGSSRVTATITPSVFEDGGKIAIVAGRGFSTAGTHYLSLKHRLAKYPDYLKNAYVFIEYPGVGNVPSASYFGGQKSSVVYKSYSDTHPDMIMAHFSLADMNFSLLKDFLQNPDNPFSAKIDMIALFFSSTYRNTALVKEKIVKLDVPLFQEEEEKLTTDGGIRTDQLDFVIQQALDTIAPSALDKELEQLLTLENLNKSAFASLIELITENGGEVFMYHVPVHALGPVTDKRTLNGISILKQWVDSKNLTVIENEKFEYDNSDFPDIWHLSIDRRDEFSSLLLENFNDILSHQHSYEP